MKLTADLLMPTVGAHSRTVGPYTHIVRPELPFFRFVLYGFGSSKQFVAAPSHFLMLWPHAGPLDRKVLAVNDHRTAEAFPTLALCRTTQPGVGVPLSTGRAGLPPLSSH